MVNRITRDHKRFRDIVRKKVRDDLKDFVNQGGFDADIGDDKVSVPIPEIDLPKFRYGDKEEGGVGMGEGEPGDEVGEEGEPGEEKGDHRREVDVHINELAEIMQDEMELPNLEPRGESQIDTTRRKYNSIAKTGPESLRHFKRSFKQALQRSIAEGEYDPDDPEVIFLPEDMRYRTFEEEPLPKDQALVFYLMDVSGSMSGIKKEIVRDEMFFLDVYLRSQYEGLENRYVIHSGGAEEVDREDFFRIKSAGGTVISSGLRMIEKLMQEYPLSQYNIYIFQFSDGDNLFNDNQKSVNKIKEMLPDLNQYSYGQVDLKTVRGQFFNVLLTHFESEEKVVLSEINSRDDIYTSIQEFFGVAP